MQRITIFSIFAILFSATAAASETRQSTVYTRIDAGDMKSVVEDYGVNATASTDSVDDPMLSFSLGGENVDMFTYGCISNTNCDGLQLRGEFRTDSSVRDINKWNAEKSWTRAYLNGDGDAILEADLSLSGGVTAKAIRLWIGQFSENLSEFRDYVR